MGEKHENFDLSGRACCRWFGRCSAVEHAGDVKNTGSRFVDVIKNNYEDQDMTQPIAH